MEVWVSDRPYAALGRRVQSHRDARGLSRKELARLAGISYDYVRAIEVGLRRPSIDVLERIAVQLGVSTSVLLGEKEAPKRPEEQAVRLVEGIAQSLLQAMVPVRNMGPIPARLESWETRGLMATTVDVPVGWVSGDDPARYFAVEVVGHLPGIPLGPGETLLCERVGPGVVPADGDLVVLLAGEAVTLATWPEAPGNHQPLGIVRKSWRDWQRR